MLLTAHKTAGSQSKRRSRYGSIAAPAYKLCRSLGSR